MSYSFSVSASSKDAAISAVSTEMAKVVANQPTHEKDFQAVVDAAKAFISFLTEPSANECVAVSVAGYLSWRDEGAFTTANVSITARISSAIPA